MIRASASGMFGSIGGWTNLLQGLGSAVVSGVVAAITAYIVVRLTHRADRRLATDVEARAAAREILTVTSRLPRELQAWASTDRKGKDRLERMGSDLTLLRYDLLAILSTHTTSIKAVDKSFANSLSHKANDLMAAVEAMGETISGFAQLAADGQSKTEGDTAVLEAVQRETARRAKEVLQLTIDVTNELRDWLVNRR
ncbi:hypothetical protein ACQPYH_02495 [Kribbella sp. CA-245084]|uniref:hypothetical protein n=1 Tax=Kribbella sp. CA-245084 TaxID=3239940 RepID=UPI003D938C4D